MKPKDNQPPAADLRRLAEQRVQERKTKRTQPEPEQDTLRLVHELQVHQIELELQNEELVAARSEIQAGLERYADLYDFAPVGYFTLDDEGMIGQANITGANLLGVPRSLLVRHRLGQFVAPEESGRWDQHLVGVLRSAEKQTCELTFKREDNSTFYARLESIRLDRPGQECRDGGNGPVIRVAMSDVTERRRAELAMARLAAIVESSDDAIVSKSLDGAILTWNQAAERMFGYRAAEIIGQPITRLLPPERLEEEAQIMRRLMCGERIEHYETVRVAKDGRRVDVSVTISPLKDPAGVVIGASKIARDITERKRAEGALRATVVELERSNQELEQFAYISSHDLQEPLRQVRAYVQLLRDRHADKLDGKAAQYMQFVYDGADRMSDLVQGLLGYSRVGATDTQRQPVSCQQALDAAVANLQAGIAESHARITHDVLPTVTAEPSHLAQLFQNLIGNAIKYHADDVQPEIHVGCRREDHGWLFWVKDNGIGIAPEFHDKVFLIFQRLCGREKYAGMGIGLTICKKIVERHGGRIWIESKAGEGCTFYFTLPEEIPAALQCAAWRLSPYRRRRGRQICGGRGNPRFAGQ